MPGQRLDHPGRADLEMAQKRLKGVIHPTPLISMEPLNSYLGKKVYLKAESLLPSGSFKLRGAYNKIASLTDAQRNRGIITASSGNHALSVTLASKWQGCKTTVVVPKTAPDAKKETCKGWGAEVFEEGDTYDDAYRLARRLEQETGKSYVHPVADTDVIAGQGTIGLEILEQLPQVKHVVVPLGGGGLVCGIAIAIKMMRPSVKITAVQPEGSAVYYCSIKENRIVELDEVHTIADGLTLKKPEPFMLELIKKWVDDVVLVREETIKKAIRLSLFKGKLIVEGAGAAALAAVLDGHVSCDGETVLIASGANIDEKKLRECLI